jgi:stage II sporulation protein D
MEGGREPGVAMNGFWTLGPNLWTLMRARPKTSAAVAFAACALALGVLSCRSTPGVGRPTSGLADSKSTGEPEVRIRIRSNIQTARLEGPRAFLVKGAGSTQTREVDAPLTLALTASGAQATGPKGDVIPLGWGVAEVTALGNASDNLTPRIRIESSLYPGRLRIYARRPGSMSEGTDRTDPRLDIIMVTGIEDYLAGVVGAELYPDWKAPGVFEVQAVCARTYALQERERSVALKQEWDLESSEEDQAYKGGTFKAEAYNAVRATRGVVLTTKGKLLRAYYSSTCGGRTAAAADVWPTGAGYEYNLAAPIQAHRREHACHDSPRYRWEVTRDRAAFSKQLREWGKAKAHALAALGTFRSVSVEKANINDRPARFTVFDTANKTYSISAEQLRVACNFRPAGAPAIARDSLVRSGDLTMELSGVKGANVVIKGRGFGHGVGMCQFCAKAMAERGDTWQEMLARFYPGAKIERAYP